MSLRSIIAPAVVLLALPLYASRLGDRVVPHRYTLRITPDLSAETFAGEEAIDLRLLQPAASIRLHTLGLQLRNVTLRSGAQTFAMSVAFEPATETAVLRAAGLIPAGPARLQLHFEGRFNQELRGFYISRTQKRSYAVTQFEATDARRAFPCFDEPSMKAVYDISLVVDTADTAISNAPLFSDTPDARGKHLLRFASTPRISSYLVAMLVGDFQCEQGRAGDVPIRVCTTPGQQALGRFALATAEAVLRYDENYFGLRYPFAKLDLIGIPDFQAGAMENAGAITFRESFLLLDDATAPIASRKFVADVIAHEIAHMWFGDLVTMKWWDDIWLNEGFATLMARAPLQAAHPEWHLELDSVEQTLTALAADSRMATRAIRTGVETPTEIFSLFDAIAYGKTASVLRMIEEWLGPEEFRRSIHQYLTRYAWDNASAEEFWASMTESSRQPVDAVLRSFVEQPGAPLLRVSERCEADQRVLDVAQERLSIKGQTPLAAEKWTIPLCVRSTTGGASACRVVMPATTSISVPSCEGALVLNRSGAGYLVAETSVGERTLIETQAARLSAAERVSLHGSEWLLVRDLREGAGDYLGLIHALAPSLGKPEEGALLAAVSGNLRFLNDRLVNQSNRARWQELLRRELGASGGEWSVAGEDPVAEIARLRMLRLRGEIGGDAESAAGARAIAERFLRDPASVPPALAAQALPVAASSGDRVLLRAILSRLDGPLPGAVREEYRVMLTSFRDPLVVAEINDYAFGKRIRTGEVRELLTGLMMNPAARPATWSAIKSHWSELQRKIPSGITGVVASTGTFCDAATRADVRSFFTSRRSEGTAEALSPALAAIDSCVAFQSAQQASFDRTLPKL